MKKPFHVFVTIIALAIVVIPAALSLNTNTAHASTKTAEYCHVQLVSGGNLSCVDSCENLSAPWVAFYNNWSFQGDQICFEKVKQINLHGYYQPNGDTWEDAARSMNASPNAGYGYDGPDGTESFLPLYRTGNLGPWSNKVASFELCQAA